LHSTTKFTRNYSLRSIAFLGVKVWEEKMASFEIRGVCQSGDTARQKKSFAILPFYTYLSSCYLSRACKFKKCVLYFFMRIYCLTRESKNKILSERQTIFLFVRHCMFEWYLMWRSQFRYLNDIDIECIQMNFCCAHNQNQLSRVRMNDCLRLKGQFSKIVLKISQGEKQVEMALWSVREQKFYEAFTENKFMQSDTNKRHGNWTLSNK